MFQTTLNSKCKTDSCPGIVLIPSPMLPGEHRSVICTKCRERHDYGTEDVYDSGTKLVIHVGRYYLDEQAFRYNERKDANGDQWRFKSVVKGCAGKRLTYKEVTGKVANE